MQSLCSLLYRLHRHFYFVSIHGLIDVKRFHGTLKYTNYDIIKGMKAYRVTLVRRTHETICTFA